MLREGDFARVIETIPYARYLGIGFDESQQQFLLPFRDDLVGNANVPAAPWVVLSKMPPCCGCRWRGI